MSQPHISLQTVNLHYASVAFKERSLKSLVARPFGKRNADEVKDVHALKNINLEITGGERVGLLGHNGAGKSTFLKTVAGLYPVSSGKVEVRGQVRSLFDLSLGFEPDATGRENILYRGLLLGLTPKFMREKQAEIVEFADLREFIDYPIKTYSAGMQVRLAFAISTAVGGDILLLDEVIGAGDANFMVKARLRIAQLIERAEILVLASHDFSALKSLCQRGVVFHRGEVVFDGAVDDAISEYKKINKIL
ncbi:polysaccharide/polyol phosphate ABC transporter ATP-binding protein [Acidovorax sp. Root267]|uniref:ABC transporter ATP-binding protein n=1 Tax=unclassified Acidovorax TaxID=2684926 RepID=UPI00070DB0F6|nr:MULTISPECIES: ABC transporter ATP-binding protein [unclassified Acidovorax]KRD15922.1 polysaccharide/polyol phosphate ABC transporter ATP-binding protein [Acidovorax sp. Root267]MBD9393514.1 ABC transporter ATP-binding protein [Acidovorax sp. ACV01]